MKRADQVTTGVIIVLTVTYMVVASTYIAGARVVPMIVGGMTLAAAVVQFVAPWVPALRPFVGELDAEDEAEIFEDPRLRRRFVMVIASLLLIPVLSFIVGLVMTLPLYVAAFMTVDRQHPAVVVGATVLIAAVSYGLIAVLLGMPVDDGRLWNLL